MVAPIVKVKPSRLLRWPCLHNDHESVAFDPKCPDAFESDDATIHFIQASHGGSKSHSNHSVNCVNSGVAITLISVIISSVVIIYSVAEQRIQTTN